MHTLCCVLLHTQAQVARVNALPCLLLLTHLNTLYFHLKSIVSRLFLKRGLTPPGPKGVRGRAPLGKPWIHPCTDCASTYAPPESKRYLQRFMGMVAYLAKFIANLSETTAPYYVSYSKMKFLKCSSYRHRICIGRKL